jgi:hypothetical protein
MNFLSCQPFNFKFAQAIYLLLRYKDPLDRQFLEILREVAHGFFWDSFDLLVLVVRAKNGGNAGSVPIIVDV